MPLSIEIDESDPPRKFKGGEIIQGTVVVINKSGICKLLSQDLVIKFVGRVDSHWKEQRKNTSHVRQYLITVYEEEFYFNETIPLKNKDPSVHKRDIRPGRTEYPFTFQLPMGLPESYKSCNGSVIYSAEVPYPKPWKTDFVVRKEFEVAGHLDLNCNLDCCLPGQFNMEKKFWFGLGRVGATLYLARRGFVPGEIVNFSLEIVNESRWYLKKIRVYFCQVTTFRAKSSVFSEGRRLHKIKCKSVYPKGTATIEGSIPVPEVPPTELGGCRLIQPEYGIMIKVIAATFGKIIKTAVLEGRVPILVGTIPVGTVYSQMPATTTIIRSNELQLTRGSDIVDPLSRSFAFGVGEREMSSHNFTNLCRSDLRSPEQQPPTYEVATSLTPTPKLSRANNVKDEGANSNDVTRSSVYTPGEHHTNGAADADELNKVLWQVVNEQHGKINY